MMETTDKEDDEKASKNLPQKDLPKIQEALEDEKDFEMQVRSEDVQETLQPQSSDKEADERGPMLPKKQSNEDDPVEDICPEFFGVRSYLHHFYESMSVKNPQLYEDIYEEDLLYVNRPHKRRQAAFCWRLFLFVGVFMLTMGILFLLYGYLTPNRLVETGYHEDMEIIDRDAIDYNNNLNFCRVLGLAVFCSGGGLICATLLLPVISNLQYDDDDDCGGLGGSDDLESFRVVMDSDESPPLSPTEKKIPATEEIKSVQPKRDEDEEMVMTNAGLCKAPQQKKNGDQ